MSIALVAWQQIPNTLRLRLHALIRLCGYGDSNKLNALLNIFHLKCNICVFSSLLPPYVETITYGNCGIATLPVHRDVLNGQSIEMTNSQTPKAECPIFKSVLH
mmetsp:Transcript_23942/g.48429  ORF Transcript_23942/g.48429 Transcript_23942/m.48429 type:complete len:104 (+) Transcript_23942:1002-1313(+)